MLKRPTGVIFCSIAFLALFASSAGHSALITYDFESRDKLNDCPGLFGKPFTACSVGDSPVIAKFEFDDKKLEKGKIEIDEEEINPLFKTVDGDEWKFGYKNSYVNWSYTAGSGDPIIRFVSGKYGKGGTGKHVVRLVWEVSDEALKTVCISKYTAECLAAAQPLTSGKFAAHALSHLTFFDTGKQVPEPGTLALLGAGLLGIGALRRRRRLV